MPNYPKFGGSKPSIKKKANNNEKKLSKRLGGRVQPASGAIDGMKGDIVVKRYLIDDKMTKHMSITLRYDQLQKLAKEALDADKEPVLILTFDSVKRGEKNFAVMPLDLFEELTQHEEG